MSNNDASQGVSKCYVFKSRLQEYAQKVGLRTPLYETIKEGPSHEPSFRSTVIVNDVRYDSLPGFFNRKAAEQSAAEVALLELAKTEQMNGCFSMPVQETGLCKNLLQEYAQKMNYAIPSYVCQKEEKPSRVSQFSCTVEIGGIKYIGGAANTKREAEIKAARTALLAIQSSASEYNENSAGKCMYTVIPCKKKATASGISILETPIALKPKKNRTKKKRRKTIRNRDTGNHFEVNNIDCHEGQPLDQGSETGEKAADSGLQAQAMEATRNFPNQRPGFNGNDGEKFSAEKVVLVPCCNGDFTGGQLTALNFYQTDSHYDHRITSIINGDTVTYPVSEGNMIPGIGQAGPMVNNSSMCQGEVPRVMGGLDQTA